MLCHFCQNLVFVPIEEVSVQNADWLTDPWFVGGPNSWLVSVHQPSRKALELSAGQGCRVCAMFWFQLFYDTGAAHARRDNDPEAVPVLLYKEQLPWDEGFGLPWPDIKLRCGEQIAVIGIRDPVSDEVSTMLDLSCALSSRPEEQYTPIGSAVDNYTGSGYNMDLIKTWIQHCQKEHHNCNTKISSETLPLLPTRVIEIETDGQTRITETKGMRAEYLTLSYCWGQGKRMLCTRGSGLCEQFKKKLPLDDTMPRTFRDALQVTKALGYRYLWIDALCIIQDDPEDVGKEMAKMGGIYQQSTLNILADHGSDTDAGLFCERDARGIKSCNIRITLNRDSKSLRTCQSIQPWPEGGISVLQTRGWVLQEELLPGRSLKFDHTEVSWSCTTASARETHPCMGELDLAEVSRRRRCGVDWAMRLIVRRPDTFDLGSPVFQFPSRRNHFDIWYEMIGNYSRRALSVDSDKLLAVAGLASLMGKHCHLTYVTGLWKEDLQVGLCWHVTSRNDMFRRNGPRSLTENFPDYLAPTWSWASAHGMCVSFWNARLDCIPEEGLQVIDVQVSHLPGAIAIFGYIEFAKLSVCTKMRRIFLAPRQENSKQNDRTAVDEEICPLLVLAFDALTGSLLGDVCLDMVKVYEDILTRFPVDRLLTDTHSPPEGTAGENVRTDHLSSDGEEAWCVPCLVQKDYKGVPWMITLVLTPLNVGRREYQRIGMMELYGEACNIFMAGKSVREDREIIHIL